MQMQVVLATFNEEADKDGDFYTKNPDGTPAGERRSCFTGSDILIGAIQKAETNLPSMNASRAQKGLPPIRLYQLTQLLSKSANAFNSLDMEQQQMDKGIGWLQKVAQSAKKVRVLFDSKGVIPCAIGRICRFLCPQSKVFA